MDYAAVNDGRIAEHGIDFFDCHCGSVICRKHITPTDWQLPDVQDRSVTGFCCFNAHVSATPGLVAAVSVYAAARWHVLWN